MTSGNYGPGQPNEPAGQQPGPPPKYGPPSGGPPYGQPPGGYGQQPPQYGQPGQYGGQPGQYGEQVPGQFAGYGPPTGSYTAPPAAKAEPGIVGIVLAVLGAVAGVIAFTATNWYQQTIGDSKFSDVHDIVKQGGDRAAVVAKAYFGWLAWVLLAVAVVAAIIACLPSPAAPALRVVGALVAVAGIVLTILALKINKHGSPSFSEWFKHAAKAPSLYLVLGGFVLIGVGALMGPRRNTY